MVDARRRIAPAIGDQNAIDATYPRGTFPADSPLARIGLAKRAQVWDACGGRCTYCGRVMHPWRDFTVDHRIPRSRGGTNALDNLVGACLSCNGEKNDILSDDRDFLPPDRSGR